MKQIIQNYRTGKVDLCETPVPLCYHNTILVRNVASLISIGTERSIIELGKMSLLGKAKARPDLVKRFMDKSRNEGFIKTAKEALERLDNPTPLGYSSAGFVLEVGKNINVFSPGDRVACIGAGYASHAEYIALPENLCSRIPENVVFDEALFGMMGIIALHGIRSAKLKFGETVAVIGLGLLGQLTAQILKAYGCRVIGIDVQPPKAELAKRSGMDLAFCDENEFEDMAERLSDGFGIDAVIVTVSTRSDVPINTALRVVRRKGRIVLVGVADIHPERNEMWDKEAEIVVSKAGGPGALDPWYENRGIDYPVEYVRWTENRNLAEFLRLIADKRIDVKPLITHRYRIEQAEEVYQELLKNKNGTHIGIMFEYRPPVPRISKKTATVTKSIDRIFPFFPRDIKLGVIGGGLFGKAILLPALKKIRGIQFDTVATYSGISAQHIARKYGFENCSTDYSTVIDNKDINAVIILTPHRLHAKMVIEGLNSGKHVFVEKPLCVSEEELNKIESVHSLVSGTGCAPFLTVGYNRRFSPHARKVSEYFENRRDPMVIHYRINAGFIPPSHWVHSKEEGGSMIVAEMCHFIDLMQFLTRSKPTRVYAERVDGNNTTTMNSDNVSIVLKFSDGSIGNIVYSTAGDRSYSRERVEIFCEGKTVVMQDFKETDFINNGRRTTFKTGGKELGYREELQCFFDVIRGKEKPGLMPEEIFYSTRAVFKTIESLVLAKTVPLGNYEHTPGF